MPSKTIEHGLHGCKRIFFQDANRAASVEKTTEHAEDTEINNNTLCSPCPLHDMTYATTRLIRTDDFKKQFNPHTHGNTKIPSHPHPAPISHHAHSTILKQKDLNKSQAFPAKPNTSGGNLAELIILK
ncbi:MAG: hypothetical protein O8C61_12445 [Candidatus Methanoperedens sp.]|nr:hypothetical protein [Candidatus Methanoperedens sp.]